MDAVFNTPLTKLFSVTPKSKHATLGRRYSTARKQAVDLWDGRLLTRAVLYCTNLDCSDLNKRQKI